jgi:hypothetical protein
VTIQSIFIVLTSYRVAILSPRSSREAVRLYTGEAERLVREVQENEFVRSTYDGDVTQYQAFQTQLKNTLRFIYASAGRLDAGETMFENELHPSYFRYMALVQAYGQHRSPEQATKICVPTSRCWMDTFAATTWWAPHRWYCTWWKCTPAE